MTYVISRGVSGRLYGGRPVRNTFIGMTVLLLLLVGGGVAYTYFLGPENVVKEPTAEEVRPKNSAFARPTPPAANAPPSAAVTMIMSPEKPGENAALAIKTVAGSDCTIKMVYGTVASTDSGLTPKKADAYGVVNWTWTVQAGAPAGTWPVHVTCVYNGRSAVVTSNLVVPK